MKSRIFFAVLTFFIATSPDAGSICKIRIENQVMVYDFSKPAPTPSIDNEIQQILQDEKGFTVVPNQISKECTMIIDDPCKGTLTQKISSAEENTDYQYKLVTNQDVVAEYPLWWDPEGATKNTLADEDIGIRIDSTYKLIDSKNNVVQYNGQLIQANHTIEGNKAEFPEIQSKSDSQRIGFVENLPACSSL